MNCESSRTFQKGEGETKQFDFHLLQPAASVMKRMCLETALWNKDLSFIRLPQTEQEPEIRRNNKYRKEAITSCPFKPLEAIENNRYLRITYLFSTVITVDVSCFK
jgi:hypothetical protein